MNNGSANRHKPFAVHWRSGNEFFPMILTPEELLAIQDNPALLDRQAITCPPSDYLWAMFGLGSELYVEPRPRQQLRLDMLNLQEDYYQRFGGHIKYCSYYSAERFRRTSKSQSLKLKGNPFAMVRDKIGDWPDDVMYCNRLFAPYTHPGFPDSAGRFSPWESNICVAAENRHRLSVHDCYMQVGDGQGGVHFETLREAVLGWCQKIRPVHGQAGFSIITSSIASEPFVYPTMRAHPGLDLIQYVSFSDSSEGVFNRIKCVNWLTVLGDEVLNELGGLETAKKVLEPGCTLYPYTGGVVIQAGPVPQLGDTEQGFIPECYRKVAQFTKVVRFEGYKYPSGGLFRVNDFFFRNSLNAVEETLKWIRRFD